MALSYANGWTKETVLAQVQAKNNGTRATSDTGECKYETGTGNRCAIGCFIPAGHRGLDSGGGVVFLLSDYPELREHMPFNQLSDLQRLQSAHDDCGDDENVHAAIAEFLDRHS